MGDGNIELIPMSNMSGMSGMAAMSGKIDFSRYYKTTPDGRIIYVPQTGMGGM
jgi:hypothetical protein